jgi:hypothetical protein
MSHSTCHAKKCFWCADTSSWDAKAEHSTKKRIRIWDAPGNSSMNFGSSMSYQRQCDSSTLQRMRNYIFNCLMPPGSADSADSTAGRQAVQRIGGSFCQSSALRIVPMTPTVHGIIHARWLAAEKPNDGWVWPAPKASVDTWWPTRFTSRIAWPSPIAVSGHLCSTICATLF